MLVEKAGGNREEAEKGRQSCGLLMAAKPTVVRLRLSQGLPTVKPQGLKGGRAARPVLIL